MTETRPENHPIHLSSPKPLYRVRRLFPDILTVRPLSFTPSPGLPLPDDDPAKTSPTPTSRPSPPTT